MITCDVWSLAIGALLVAATVSIGVGFRRRRRPQTPKLSNVVYLYQIRRPAGPWGRAPNASPFCIRVEAFLRLHKIPYIVEYPLRPPSRSERFPCIELNGVVYEDSHYIIQHLKAAFGVEGALSQEQEVTETTLRRVLDLSCYWLTMRWLFVDHPAFLDQVGAMPLKRGSLMRRLLLKYVRGQVITTLNGTGLGDLSHEQYHSEWVADVKAVESMLQHARTKAKWLGGETPNSLDCLVYGSIAAWASAPAKSDCGKDVFDPPALQYARGSAPIREFISQFEALVFPDLADLVTRNAGEPERFLDGA